jgi:hypothetical protein
MRVPRCSVRHAAPWLLALSLVAVVAVLAPTLPSALPHPGSLPAQHLRTLSATVVARGAEAALARPLLEPPRAHVVVPLRTEEDRLYARVQATPGEMDLFVDAFLAAPLVGGAPVLSAPPCSCVTLIVRQNPHAAPDVTRINATALGVRALLPVVDVDASTADRTTDPSDEVLDLPLNSSVYIKHCRLRCSINGKDNPARDNLSAYTYVQRLCHPQLGAALANATAAAARGLAITVTYAHADPILQLAAERSTTVVRHYQTTLRVYPAAPWPPLQPRAALAMVTLFLPTPELLYPWIEHYSALGVGFFYLYYNGRVRDAAGALVPALTGPAMRAVLARPDVQLVEWTPPFQDVWGIRQGQAPAMQSSYNRFRPLHDWLLYFDMDEYLVLPLGTTLPAYLAAQPADCAPIQFPSAFAWLDCSPEEDHGAAPTTGSASSSADSHSRLASADTSDRGRPADTTTMTTVTEGMLDLATWRARCALRHTGEWHTLRRQKMAVPTRSHVAVLDVHQARSESKTERACVMDTDSAYFAHILNLSPDGRAPRTHGSINATAVDQARRAAIIPVPGWRSGGG